MPSIAQQDYIVIKTSASPRPFTIDAAALSQIAGCMSRGNIYDCLLQNYDGNNEYFARIIAFAPSSKAIFYYEWNAGEVDSIEVSYTATQYQGLAAVQQAIDEQEGMMDRLPVLTADGNHYLAEDDFGGYICVDNKFLLASPINMKIASLTMADTGPGEGDDFVNITWEDAQKLIGLPLV